MGLFGGPIKRAQQPAYPTPAIKHGLGDKLEVAVNCAFRHPVDLAKNRKITYDAGVFRTSSVPVINGIAKQFFPSNGSITVDTFDINSASNTDSASFCIILNRTATPTNSFNIWRLSSANFDQITVNGTLYSSSAFWQGGFWLTDVSFDQPSSGEMIIILTVRDGLQRAYINGKLFGSNNLTGGMRIPATIEMNSTIDGKVYGFFTWNRFLQEHEVLEITRNPWQLLEPVQRNIWTSLPGPITGKAPLYLNYDKGTIDSAKPSTQLYNSIVPYDVTPGYGTTYITFANSSEGHVDVAAGLQPINPTKVKVWVDPTDTSTAASVISETKTVSDLTENIVFSMRKFDPINGTLTAAKLMYSLRTDFEFDSENTDIVPGTATFTYNSPFGFTISPYSISLPDVDKVIILSLQVGETKFAAETLTVSETDYVNLSTHASTFIGSGNLTLVLEDYFGGPFTTTTATVDFLGGSSVTRTATVTIQYEYVSNTGPKTANDHRYLPLFAKFTVAANPNGNGFRIYGRSKEKLNGTFKVRYSYT